MSFRRNHLRFFGNVELWTKRHVLGISYRLDIMSLRCLRPSFKARPRFTLGLGQDQGLLSVLRFVRWLAGYRFFCCDFYLIRTDLKSVIGSRLIRLVWYESSIFPETIFKPTGSARPKFRIFFVARFRPCVGRLKIKRVIRLRLFKTADVFVGANRRMEYKICSGRVWTICSYYLDF